MDGVAAKDKLFQPGPSGMKPIIIMPPGVMGEEAIQALRENDLCVVIATEPSKVKFLDPIPAMAGRTKVDDAAILLSRKILGHSFWQNPETRKTVAAAYVDILVKGTALDPDGDKEDRHYDAIKLQELERLAREDARAERAAKRAEKAGKK